MRTEQKIFNDLIETIVNNSENNEAKITNVELWAKSWKEEMKQALTLTDVVCSTDWEQVISEHETATDFAIFIINEAIRNVKPYQNGTGLHIDYETIYKNCLPKEVD
jgi:hypothetical protein